MRVSYTHFLPQKTFQPFIPYFIYLGMKDLKLKGLKDKPFTTIHGAFVYARRVHRKA